MYLNTYSGIKLVHDPATESNLRAGFYYGDIFLREPLLRVQIRVRTFTTESGLYIKKLSGTVSGLLGNIFSNLKIKIKIKNLISLIEIIRNEKN